MPVAKKITTWQKIRDHKYFLPVVVAIVVIAFFLLKDAYKSHQIKKEIERKEILKRLDESYQAEIDSLKRLIDVNSKDVDEAETEDRKATKERIEWEKKGDVEHKKNIQQNKTMNEKINRPSNTNDDRRKLLEELLSN